MHVSLEGLALQTSCKTLALTDDAAGDARAGVSGLLALGISALAEIVGLLVDHEGAADDGLGSVQRDLRVMYSDRRRSVRLKGTE